MRSTAFAFASLVALVAAHGPSTPDELAAYRARQQSIYHCAPIIAEQVAERKRHVQQVLGGAAAATDAATMFLGGNGVDGEGKLLSCNEEIVAAKMRNHSCVLSPETTQGPYYHDRGHPIRQSMAELQLGIPFLMDVGVIDVKTCKPLPDILVDVWHANSTGHYAGHPEPDPILKWEGPKHEGPRKGLLSKYPRTIQEETWLRAAWPTNKNGVSQFSSIFPGYYTGRATHVHVKIIPEWEPVNNGTFTTFNAKRLIHTGQFFVDDAVNDAVDKLHPYSTNPIREKWGRTRNWVDSLQIFQDSHQNGYNPTFELEKLGGVLQQGFIGYITVGVDLDASYPHTEAWTP